MFLYEVFPPELIKTGLTADNKDGVFQEMVDHFCLTGKAGTRDEILEVLWDRESKMSTGITNGVAIPHGITDSVDSVHGILGISKTGIDYDALDKKPVHLVFMLLAPKNLTERYMQLLAHLAELLENPDFIKDLAAQTDPESANQILNQYEKKSFPGKL